MNSTCIKGFEGIYSISTSGEIYSLPRKIVDVNGQIRNIKGRQLKPGKQMVKQTELVNLSKNGKTQTKTVGIFMAMTYFPEYNPSIHRVCHRNDWDDNSLSNLYLATR